MIAACRRLLLGGAIAVWVGTGSAPAGTLIEFPNVAGQATPAHLRGYLARPDAGLSALLGSGASRDRPYPAVVVLHGCGGFSGHGADVADQIGSWGYVALAVDSFGPRDIASRCGGSRLLEQATDAYAALRYLAGLDFVDAARVALLGQSMGGLSTLYAVDRDLTAQYFVERFHAAIAYYPSCGIPSPMLTAPTLILIGEADDWNPAERCQAMAENARPEGAPITVVVYPGAYHAFDVAGLGHGVTSLGHRLEYNAAAARDAAKKLRDFLARHLGGADAAH